MQTEEHIERNTGNLIWKMSSGGGGEQNSTKQPASFNNKLLQRKTEGKFNRPRSVINQLQFVNLIQMLIKAKKKKKTDDIY